jgi:LacI family transcriptional regulator
LVAGTGFDCVFAHNDLSAAGALRAIHDAGLRVPEDVAIVGFDDVPLATYTEPTLTTVHQPLREMGERAARMLMALFDGTSPSGTPEILPTALVVRGSTRS